MTFKMFNASNFFDMKEGWTYRSNKINFFIQNQIFGMEWLNEIIGKILKLFQIDIHSQVGSSIHFFLYDVVKITVLLCVLIL